MANPSGVTVLLGAQSPRPTLASVLSEFGLEGPYALVSAGWQEREPEDEELRAHVGAPVENLALNARAQAVFRADPEFSAAHREKQELLRHMQDVYRIRLEHAFAAERDVRTYLAPEAVRAEVESASIEAIQGLDRAHLTQCQAIGEGFEDRYCPGTRPAVVEHRAQVLEQLERCAVVLVAGGHVALLLNRLALFDLSSVLAGRAVVGWSAGAMALTERVVLFHDDAPQGRVARELLGPGLGRAKKVVALPEPERRLSLDATDRAALMARRFAPAECLILPAGSFVAWSGETLNKSVGVERLDATGRRVSLSAEVAA